MHEALVCNISKYLSCIVVHLLLNLWLIAGKGGDTDHYTNEELCEYTFLNTSKNFDVYRWKQLPVMHEALVCNISKYLSCIVVHLLLNLWLIAGKGGDTDHYTNEELCGYTFLNTSKNFDIYRWKQLPVMHEALVCNISKYLSCIVVHLLLNLWLIAGKGGDTDHYTNEELCGYTFLNTSKNFDIYRWKQLPVMHEALVCNISKYLSCIVVHLLLNLWLIAGKGGDTDHYSNEELCGYTFLNTSKNFDIYRWKQLPVMHEALVCNISKYLSCIVVHLLLNLWLIAGKELPVMHEALVCNISKYLSCIVVHLLLNLWLIAGKGGDTDHYSNEELCGYTFLNTSKNFDIYRWKQLPVMHEALVCNISKYLSCIVVHLLLNLWLIAGKELPVMHEALVCNISKYLSCIVVHLLLNLWLIAGKGGDTDHYSNEELCGYTFLNTSKNFDIYRWKQLPVMHEALVCNISKYLSCIVVHLLLNLWLIAGKELPVMHEALVCNISKYLSCIVVHLLLNLWLIAGKDTSCISNNARSNVFGTK
ncbi:unnamed protein product [Arctogadus glacialis]